MVVALVRLSSPDVPMFQKAFEVALLGLVILVVAKNLVRRESR